MHPLISLLLLLFTLTACQHSPVVYAYQATPTDGWEPTDTLHFTTDTLRETGTYDLHVGLRTATARPYAYHSLWLVIEQDWQRPERHLIDTIECRLADRQGDQTGEGVTLYQYELPAKRLSLEENNYAHIRVHHIMRNDLLRGITDVGIKLERTEE